MSPAMALAVQSDKDDEPLESEYQKGVRYLCERGITKVPSKYTFPVLERPGTGKTDGGTGNTNLTLPILDFSRLQGSNRIHVLKSLSEACAEYGCFQLINHGISSEAILDMIEVGRKFFELPFEERSKYMSKDMHSPVRCGTSFSQKTDRVFCWRDFLKLSCQPLEGVLPSWPSSPPELRQAVATYSKKTKALYLMLVEAILESLGVVETAKSGNETDTACLLEEFQDGSQLIMINCYPSCPEPDLTLGMHPHSDYGFLTLLLQDEVKGLQIQHQGKWVTVEPIPLSFVVNVGDHLEIFSNGRYKSVLHRVLVNPSKSRISIASLHSLPFNSTMQPSPKLVNEANPRRYKDTDFASFVKYITSFEHKNKNFLDSRKID